MKPNNLPSVTVNALNQSSNFGAISNQISKDNLNYEIRPILNQPAPSTLGIYDKTVIAQKTLGNNVQGLEMITSILRELIDKGSLTYKEIEILRSYAGKNRI